MSTATSDAPTEVQPPARRKHTRTRRVLASIVVGLGVFLITAALLLRFYAYPTLAQAPRAFSSTTELEAIDAEIFNSSPDVLDTEVTDLSIVSTTTGDSGAETPDGVVVWVNQAVITKEDGTIFQQSTERSPFDAVSGEAVDCAECGQWVEVVGDDGQPVQQDVVRDGVLLKFPFDTQPQDYEVWDGTVGAAVTAEYQGSTTIDGLEVYEFQQNIEPTVVDQREVPGSIFDSEQPSVQADVVYSMQRTFFVEPITGSPVNRVEQRDQSLQAEGVEVPAFVGTVRYTDEQVSSMVEDAKESTALGSMRTTYPLVAGGLGVLVLIGGLLLKRRPRG